MKARPMKNSLNHFFHALPPAVAMPEGFEARVFSALRQAQQQEIRRMLILSKLSIAISGGISLVMLWWAGASFVGSEFARLVSLLLSDTTLLVGSSGRELLWLVLETFPALPAALILAPIFVFLLLLARHVTVTHRSPLSSVSRFSLA